MVGPAQQLFRLTCDCSKKLEVLLQFLVYGVPFADRCHVLFILKLPKFLPVLLFMRKIPCVSQENAYSVKITFHIFHIYCGV